MKTILLSFLIIFKLSIGFSQTPALEWGTAFGGTAGEVGRSIAYDSHKNVYITGTFRDTVDFDAGPGVSKLGSQGLQDIYVAKFDSLGNFMWVKQFGSVSTDISYSIVVTNADELLVSGMFDDTIDFDPGIGVHLLGPSDQGSAARGFILKLDSAGNFGWVKKMGDHLRVNLDIDNNVLVYGNFAGTKDFNPSSTEVYNLTATASAFGTNDLFVAKLNSNFEFLWAYKYGGYLDDGVTALKTDTIGNIYVVGSLRATIDFDPGPGVFNLVSGGGPPINSNLSDIYMVKYDPNGQFVWGKRMGSYNQDYPYDLALDKNANLYICGVFNNTVDFDPNAGVFSLTAPGAGNGFHAKYNSNGELVWVNSTTVSPFCLAFDEGDLFVSGYLSGPTGSPGPIYDMDPGITVFNLNSVGSYDTYVSLFDDAGNFQYAKRFGGAALEQPSDLIVDDQGGIYVSGHFNTGVTNLGEQQNPILFTANSGGDDVFLAKLQRPAGVMGKVFLDTNQNCNLNLGEIGLDSIHLTIQPGNIDVMTNLSGVWFHDSLPLGNYTITITVPSIYNLNCLITQNFTVLDTISTIDGLNFGLTADFGFIEGTIFHDLNGDCNKNVTESGLSNRVVHIQPGNVTIQTNSAGYYRSDTLALGSYTVTVDTNYNWGASCMDTLMVNNIPWGSTIVQTNFGLEAKFGFIEGYIFNDWSGDCIKNAGENGIPSRLALIQPGNQVVQANSLGYYKSDTLAVGSYTITADTNSNWAASCLNTIPVNNVQWGSPIVPTNIGLESVISCANPVVSINSPLVRPCFDGSFSVYAQNLPYAISPLTNAYIIVEIDTLIDIVSASMPYTSLGDGQYRVDLGTLNPGQVSSITFYCHYNCQMIVGRTYCFDARIYPVDSCVYDTVPAAIPPDFSPCNLPWDNSSLSVDGYCQNDSIYFSVTNNALPGFGDMECYSPVRVYINTSYILLDSVQLAGGETRVFTFSADRRTWRFEVDQHPLHPGNSHPNVTLEACGNVGVWTSNLVNSLPQDDADPFVDINCAVARLSYDPNDKIGFPLGVGVTNDVSPNGKIDYVINFQNTGTDTAFTVVIRDTLDMDLDIFTVQSGGASHPYSFEMHGPRVLEWTFANIQLPDSTTNEALSHGFVTFSVDQHQNLPNGSVINNTANIYFDYNEPIVTNTTTHTIQEDINLQAWSEQDTLDVSVCEGDFVVLNGVSYSDNGTYYQLSGDFGLDTLLMINVLQSQPTSSTIAPLACSNYTAPDGQVYTSSGMYSAMIPNTQGCDSLITIDLTILHPTSSTITETSCSNYTAPDGQVYNSSGIYTAFIANTQGCDSIITIDLTIDSIIPTITNNSPSLHADMDNAVYQWLDCNNSYMPIAGETNQNFTPTTNGLYAVQINLNACFDTSDCFLVTSVGFEQPSDERIKLYPNPSIGEFTLDFGASLNNARLFVEDITGRIVYEADNITDQKVDLKLKEAPGAYYVIIKFASGEIQKLKLILE